MGWDTIQPGTASAVVGQPSEPEPSPHQTALAGHKIETAPPSGFRQRIAQAFVQFGRRLSSLVRTAPSGARTDAESAERGTRKELVSLLNCLGSGDFDSPKVGAGLDRLAAEKQRWMQEDPEHGEQKFGDMLRSVLDQRRPGKKTMLLQKITHAMSLPALAHLPQEPLRKQLAALVGTKADDYRAQEALKARHKDEIQRLGFTRARKIADGVFWKGPTLSAALKAFDKATKDCEYKPGATEAELKASRDALEEAGNRLLEALEASHPAKAQTAVAGRLFGDHNWKALYIQILYLTYPSAKAILSAYQEIASWPPRICPPLTSTMKPLLPPSLSRVYGRTAPCAPAAAAWTGSGN